MNIDPKNVFEKFNDTIDDLNQPKRKTKLNNFSEAFLVGLVISAIVIPIEFVTLSHIHKVLKSKI